MERAPAQKSVHSKIRHQSFGVGRKESEARSEHRAGEPPSGGLRLLNVSNSQSCMYKNLAAFVSLSKVKPEVLHFL